MANCMLARQLTSGNDWHSTVRAKYAQLRIGCQLGWSITRRVAELKARLREKQLKTGFGRAYLKRRLD
jgi:hypothetical protein